jgi:alpha-beta hydrolase superfamily lysophospholipase
MKPRGWESRDRLEMFAQSWEPEEPPRAVVCLVHGLGEHSGRYAHVGKAFADAGKMTLGFGKIMLSVLPWTFEHANEFSMPLLIMHGKDDKLGYPRGSEEFASHVKQNCTLKL